MLTVQGCLAHRPVVVALRQAGECGNAFHQAGSQEAGKSKVETFLLLTFLFPFMTGLESRVRCCPQSVWLLLLS